MDQKATEFKAGDVVQLKSGGPPMTVVAADGTGVQCRWFSPGVRDNEAYKDAFPVACVMPCPPQLNRLD